MNQSIAECRYGMTNDHFIVVIGILSTYVRNRFVRASIRPVFSYNVPLFMCSSVTLIPIDNRFVTVDAVLCNWHFYNDVNIPGG
jgi:hypothetical protein